MTIIVLLAAWGGVPVVVTVYFWSWWLENSTRFLWQGARMSFFGILVEALIPAGQLLLTCGVWVACILFFY